MTQYEQLLNRFIPEIKFPSIGEYEIEGIDEPLVSLRQNGFTCESYYYNQGVPGALKDCYVRQSLIEKLHQAVELLPDNLTIKVYDGYRPVQVQHRLWNHYRAEIKIKHPEYSDEDLDFRTSFFISKPSYDIMNPSLHNTGGAIDLTLITLDGKELNMGTKFDDFTNRAWTNHFETYYSQGEADEEVRNNRRLLYNVMLSVGFTNLPSEWWHYDYGTKFWAFFTGNKALYQGIINHGLPNEFPLM